MFFRNQKDSRGPLIVSFFEEFNRNSEPLLCFFQNAKDYRETVVSFFRDEKHSRGFLVFFLNMKNPGVS